MTYTFYQRLKADANHYASDSSNGARGYSVIHSKEEKEQVNGTN